MGDGNELVCRPEFVAQTPSEKEYGPRVCEDERTHRCLKVESPLLSLDRREFLIEFPHL